jgi:hypothetical protein
MEAAADLPYWQYIAVMDGRTTDTCRDMHGRVFRADDPIWNSLYPPNHWGCRARVRSLTERMVEREGLTVESSDGRMVEQTVMVGKGDKARKETVTGLKLGNGKVFWAGPGWDYNPGTSLWMPDLSKYHPGDARAFVTDSFRGPAYKFFVESMGKIAGEIPIAVLPVEYMKGIGAKTNIVKLSAATLRDHTHHTEITPQDYLNLQTIVEKAQTILLQSTGKTLAFIQLDDKYYFATIKTTIGKDELYVTSLRLTNPHDIKRQKDNAKRIIKDGL